MIAVLCRMRGTRIEKLATRRTKGGRHLSNAVHLNIFSLGIIPANSSDPLRSGAKDRGVKNRRKGERGQRTGCGSRKVEKVASFSVTRNEWNESPSYHLRYKNISILVDLESKLFQIILKFSQYIYSSFNSLNLIQFPQINIRLLLWIEGKHYRWSKDIRFRIVEIREIIRISILVNVFPKFFNLIDRRYYFFEDQPTR